jgi:hypothetical protein
MGSGGGGGAACTPSHSAACTPSHSVPGRRGPRTRARRATQGASCCSSLGLLRGCAEEALPALRVARGLGSLHGRGPHGRRSEHRRPRCAGGGRWRPMETRSFSGHALMASVRGIGGMGGAAARGVRGAAGEGCGRGGPRTRARRATRCASGGCVGVALLRGVRVAAAPVLGCCVGVPETPQLQHTTVTAQKLYSRRLRVSISIGCCVGGPRAPPVLSSTCSTCSTCSTWRAPPDLSMVEHLLHLLHVLSPCLATSLCRALRRHEANTRRLLSIRNNLFSLPRPKHEPAVPAREGRHPLLGPPCMRVRCARTRGCGAS